MILPDDQKEIENFKYKVLNTRATNMDIFDTLYENDIVMQEDELTEVRWFSMEELDNMVKTGELNPDQIACFVKVCNFIKKEEV